MKCPKRNPIKNFEANKEKSWRFLKSKCKFRHCTESRRGDSQKVLRMPSGPIRATKRSGLNGQTKHWTDWANWANLVSGLIPMSQQGHPMSQQGFLSMYLIPGIVGRRVRFGSESLYGGGAGGVGKSGSLEI